MNIYIHSILDTLRFTIYCEFPTSQSQNTRHIYLTSISLSRPYNSFPDAQIYILSKPLTFASKPYAHHRTYRFI